MLEILQVFFPDWWICSAPFVFLYAADVLLLNILAVIAALTVRRT